ncbi:MAG: hypothetical protein NT062_13640 [Proteobacteria bacterium]|nr:hypothetical protein [Pseudomonadota bacterium]
MIAIVAIVFAASTDAHAGGRKRLVVLDFEGPKAEKFQEDVIKLLKKNHTVLSTEKWTAAAEELDAAKVTEKNVKKVAKKLKIDGVIEGKIEKRRDEYIIKIKLCGKDGDIVGKVDTKSESSKLEGTSLKDLKDELLPVVEALEGNRAGGKGDDEEETPKKKVEKVEPVKKKGGDEDEEEPAPKKSGFGGKKTDKKGSDAVDEEDAPRKKPTTKKKVSDEEDENPLPMKKKPTKVAKPDVAEEEGEGEGEDGEVKKPAKKKRAAKRGDDEEALEEGNDEAGDEPEEPNAAALSPGERAVDAVVGLSVMARRMAFTYSADLGSKPPGYKGVPAGGLLVDATLYPLAMSHKRSDLLKNLGLNLMVDKVVKISSQALINNVATKLETSTIRYSFGAVFRYPFNKTPTSPVIGASINFGGQSFTIAQNDVADIPNVSYTIIDPNLFFKYPVSDKFTFNLDAGLMLFTDTGQIQTPASYGAASVTGFEGEISGDYMVSKNLFARAAFRFETIGFKFTGKGMKATGRDADMEQDVFGARDSYLGGAVTLGYVY